MAKGNILSDTFEQLAELGASTAKQTVKAVGQIVNPFDKAKTSEVNREQNPGKTSEVKRGNNHTPVDFDKLKNKFQDKDKLQAEALRNRLFQNVKREDEKIIQRKDMEEAQKKSQEEQVVQEKKRREQQQKNQNQQSGIPTGKAKRGFMAQKKVSDQQHVENKPASGKQ
ncbi:conserved hypothetical protein [Candidatus Roizmanbacteria bacterium]|nr:conserved hypothetical protein [Candidatus Roizmanbacteria bacterium]